MKLKYVEEFVCIVCKRTFLRRTKSKKTKISLNVRKCGCVTCSKTCSKIHQRERFK